ncbi:MAG TPA: Rne/Rng family ribonuclease [Candidatus Acidoferrum sp.]|nr:Rne/Rng family ribonuclease [Candidatus Acidoferrum sp.]
MTRRMLIEATHPEETRVVVVDGKRLEEFDYESANKRQLKGNIYLAKITRVEPSLQAAFVDYGGNRHGFLAFSEIHPDYYRIPVADREALLAEHAAMAAADAASDNDDEEDLATNTQADLAASAPEPAETIDAAPPSADDDEGADASRSSDEEAEAAGPSDETGEALPLTMSTPRLFGPEIEAGGDEASSDEAPSDDASADAQPPAEGNGSGEAQSATEATDQDAPAESVERPEPARPPTSLETVGGDEAEEVRRRRSRPLRRYKIQEVIKRRQIMLVQVTKEERGNKGAALTTYLSLAGRYCVLMPNTGRGGGISRKITNATDRKRLKSILEEFDIPDGMAVIVRTAGSERNKTELRRDYEYLVRLWDEIRQLTLQSTAPTLIYEEASLIKRAIRDLYARDIEEVLVEGDDAYKAAKNFMRTLMPSHAKRVQLYKDEASHLFHRFMVESQLDAIHNPTVNLRSGGYIVINSTEALVAIDVNSGRATRERNIEETALRTNQEAADEIGRQLRLRDLAGLIVIDFIDMEEHRNNAAVERRLKDAMRHDRARIQVGRISAFGLLELSRQRLRPSLIEASTEICRHCRGTGHVRSTESTALHVLRAIEEEGIRNRSTALAITVPTAVALYVLNNKRAALAELEQRHNLRLTVGGDDTLIPPEYRMERSKTQVIVPEARAPISQPDTIVDEDIPDEEEEETTVPAASEAPAQEQAGGRRRSRRRRRGRRDEGRHDDGRHPPAEAPARVVRAPSDDAGEPAFVAAEDERDDDDALPAVGGAADEARPSGEARDQDSDMQRRRRRRGRRGGRRRRRGGDRPGEESRTMVSPVAHDDSSDPGVRSWADDSPTATSSWEDSDRPAESAAEPATPDDEQPPYRTGSDEPEHGRSHGVADIAHEEPVETSGQAATAVPADSNGSGPAPAAAAPEPAEQPPPGPPKRGWWKRLIE